MKILIHNQEHTLIELKTFREQYHLPDTFGIALFEGKDYTGLAHIDKAGIAMNHIKERLLATIPKALNIAQLMGLLSDLEHTFRVELSAINNQINLKDSEVDYAVSGFQDVCQTIIFELVRAHSQHIAPSPFHIIYMNWLNNSVRLSSPAHPYPHHDALWQVQVINTVYGRIGLYIQHGEQETCVHDSKLACPAEGFMFTLLSDIAQKVTSAMNTQY